MKRPLASLVCLATALSLAGCGILFPGARLRATKNTPGFKAGYTDGCAAAAAAAAGESTGDIRDKAAYETDPTYRKGWASGMANCRNPTSPSPERSPVPDVSPGSPNF